MSLQVKQKYYILGYYGIYINDDTIYGGIPDINTWDIHPLSTVPECLCAWSVATTVMWKIFWCAIFHSLQDIVEIFHC